MKELQSIFDWYKTQNYRTRAAIITALSILGFIILIKLLFAIPWLGILIPAGFIYFVVSHYLKTTDESTRN